MTATTSTTMTALDVHAALRAKYPQAALVREVVVNDQVWAEAWRAQWCHHHPDLADYSAERWGPVPEYSEEHRAYLAAGTAPQRRIDVLMLSAGLRTAVEIKVSRADFRRDTEYKRRPWQDVVHRFVYATPAGLITPDEVPDGCGLWEVLPATERAQARVKVARRARIKRTPAPLPDHVVVALAYRAMRADAT